MSYSTFIDELILKNAALFAAGKIKISPDAFAAQLRRAYDAGYADATRLHQQIAEIEARRKSVFENIFGK